MTTLETLDFFHDDALIADPYPVLDQMRKIDPVLREPVHGVMIVTGYDEAMAVVSDPDTFSSCTSVTGPIPGFPVPLEGLSDDEVRAAIDRHRDELPFSDQLPSFDPPKHTAHRSLLSRLITPKRLKENEEFMWTLADRVLDPFLANGGGEFISEVATRFALLVVADLLGVPEEDHAALTAELTGDMALGSTDDAVMAHTPLEHLYARFTDYIADRRNAPRDDVMTGMALATFPDGATSEVIDVVRVAANLFSAGQETTVRLLSTALQLLAEDTKLQARLRTTPADIPNFIEECLRFESPIKGDFRLARATTTVGGVEIPAGTTLMVHLGAANRDPRIFDNPGTFDPDRPNARRHIGFGRGEHSCIGAPLARAEGRVLIQRLLERTTDVGVDEAVHGPKHARRYTYVPTYILRGLTALHVRTAR
ncbi:cytochrome P450 [Mycobacterium sp. GA-2829]|uniref:cytochrome P450 n=1 Tax=Mycobacterium sp. GA-2829 TaxID=1772283 RepID=UPI000740444E|nr:cytochrome P450 [Mycobacterium sp. GA-2829]KUI27477.1 cytochrome [Mycobacterium sp. GA-2829]